MIKSETTPARAEAQDEGAAGEWPEKWSGPCTVGNMIANLRTLPPGMPIYTAYHIPMDGEPSLLRVKRPTMSRERVDGITIKTGDESVPYSAVIWTQPQNPLEAHPSPTTADDADRVRAWDAFAAHSNWELSHGYPDGEEEDSCWLVHSVNGGRNDREWTLIGRGETPLDAALAALKSTAAKEGNDNVE